MSTFQNKWVGILCQKHGKQFMLWLKLLPGDEWFHPYYNPLIARQTMATSLHNLCELFFILYLYFQNHSHLFLLVKHVNSLSLVHEMKAIRKAALFDWLSFNYYFNAKECICDPPKIFFRKKLHYLFRMCFVHESKHQFVSV